MKTGTEVSSSCPCRRRKVMDLSPDSDATGLTPLVQLNDVQRFINYENGKWVPIRPILGAFIVNIGDVLEKKHHLAIAAFHGPHIKSMIGPLPELVKGSKDKYKTMNNEDYLRLLLSSKFEEMEPEVLKREDYEDSLPVENVQALASKNLKAIPPRFLQPEAKFDQVSIEESLEIPVIDMSKLLDDQHPLNHHYELARLHLACKDSRFF
ncbi:Oxoglutarate/iron-dependent dioxygenase [Parasponia andersonii]|uniref:Oxoglutarate/iron-dependent dioxygenase n=1 Tax=Parasponia andersonii TaxID=3476 RepID=A0A2P5C7Q2_PARAD|nr:Oxoglutarate/iron-dependent dioxygenase [Parasponia andersonii]